MLQTMPPSTPSPRFRVANRFCSKADVSCSIYAACAFIAKVSPDSGDAMHSIGLTTQACPAATWPPGAVRRPADCDHGHAGAEGDGREPGGNSRPDHRGAARSYAHPE